MEEALLLLVCKSIYFIQSSFLVKQFLKVSKPPQNLFPRGNHGKPLCAPHGKLVCLYAPLNDCNLERQKQHRMLKNPFPANFPHIKTRVQINQRYAVSFCVRARATALSLKRQRFWNWNVAPLRKCHENITLLHSMKINKQGHPNFQLVLQQNAGNGLRAVRGRLRLGRGHGTVTGRFAAKEYKAQCEDGSSPRKTTC